MVEGEAQITITATDHIGNVTQQTVAVIKDTAPPELAVDGEAARFTPHTEAELTGTATDALSGIAHVIATSSRLPTGSYPASVGSDGRYTARVPLIEGENLITLTATDRSGNTTAQTVTVIQDAIAPDLTLDGEWTRYTVDSTALLTGTVSDSISGIADLFATSTRLPDWVFRVSIDGNGRYRAELPLLEGENIITLTATDRAGNRSTLYVTVVQDAVPPELTVDGDASRITPEFTMRVSGTATDPISGIASIKAASSRFANQVFDVNLANDGRYIADLPLLEGENLLTVIATDRAGNSAQKVITVIQDAKPPQLSLDGDATRITAENSTHLTGTASDSISGLAHVKAISSRFEGQIYVARLEADGRYAVDVPLLQGDNDLTVIATDQAGNTSQVAVKVIADSAPPELSIEGEASRITQSTMIVLAGTATDAITGVASMQATSSRFTGQVFRVVRGSDNRYTAEVPLQEGTNVITVRATDQAGNTAERSVTVVQDAKAPELVISGDPSRITQGSGASLSGTSSDSISGIAIIQATSSRYPGQTFNVTLNSDGTFTVDMPLEEGENVLTVTTTDNAGNVTTQIVTVIQDSKAPQISIEGEASRITADDTVRLAGSASDAISGLASVIATSSRYAGQSYSASVDSQGHYTVETPLVEGENTLTLTATDRAGNAAEISVNVIRDSTPPALTIDGPATRTTRESTLLLTGTATDGGTGVIRIQASSSRFADQSFAGELGNAGTYSIEVPVLEDDNLVAVVATDRAGNTAERAVTITQILPPKVTIQSPADATITADPTITVSGTVRVRDASNTVRVLLGSYQQTAQPTGYRLHSFSFVGVPLNAGANPLTVRVESPSGIGEDSVTVVNNAPLTPDDIGPAVTLRSPSAARPIADSSVVVSGQATDPSGIQQVLINGQPAVLQGSDPRDRSFEYWLDLSGQADGTFSVTVAAFDGRGNQTLRTLSLVRDGQGPVIEITTPVLTAERSVPTVENPLRIAGTVSDAQLAGFTINGRSVDLLPGSQSGVYQFDTEVPVPYGAEVPIRLVAWDRAGTESSTEFTVRAAATARLELIQPQEGAELLVEEGTTAMAVVARVSNAPTDARAHAQVGNVTVELARDETSFTGNLSLSAIEGEQQLVVKLTDVQGTVLAQASARVRVVDGSRVPLAVGRLDPENGATGVEPNDALGVYFNKPIDPAKVQIRLRENFHGQSYDPANFSQLVDVHRDQEEVPGQLSFLPGNRVAMFYPRREPAYGATVLIEVHYDGKEIARSTYGVRALPTMVQGMVADQFSEPAAGIEVRLPELGLRTVTNNDGAYSFGLGQPAERDLPAGRYRMEFNPGLRNPLLGTVENWAMLEAGRLNRISLTKLPVLSRDTPFLRIKGGQPHVELAQGDLVLDLSQASLAFPDRRTEGDIHVQFMPPDRIQADSIPSATPLWVFAAQPVGTQVNGSVSLQINPPALYGSRAYLPTDGSLVLIIGFDAKTLTLQPAGVARMEDRQIKSARPIALTSLDYIGVALVSDIRQPLLQRFVDGEIALPALIRELEQ